MGAAELLATVSRLQQVVELRKRRLCDVFAKELIIEVCWLGTCICVREIKRFRVLSLSHCVFIHLDLSIVPSRSELYMALLCPSMVVCVVIKEVFRDWELWSLKEIGLKSSM